MCLLKHVYLFWVSSISFIFFFLYQVIFIVIYYRGLDRLFIIYCFSPHELRIERPFEIVRVPYPSFLMVFFGITSLQYKYGYLICQICEHSKHLIHPGFMIIFYSIWRTKVLFNFIFCILDKNFVSFFLIKSYYLRCLLHHLALLVDWELLFLLIPWKTMHQNPNICDLSVGCKGLMSLGIFLYRMLNLLKSQQQTCFLSSWGSQTHSGDIGFPSFPHTIL